MKKFRSLPDILWKFCSIAMNVVQKMLCMFCIYIYNVYTYNIYIIFSMFFFLSERNRILANRPQLR